MFLGFQREDRLILKETKVWIEQFERDLTRAQMTESNLQDKYQVSVGKRAGVSKAFHAWDEAKSWNVYLVFQIILMGRFFKQVTSIVLSVKRTILILPKQVPWGCTVSSYRGLSYHHFWQLHLIHDAKQKDTVIALKDLWSLQMSTNIKIHWNQESY